MGITLQHLAERLSKIFHSVYGKLQALTWAVTRVSQRWKGPQTAFQTGSQAVPSDSVPYFSLISMSGNPRIVCRMIFITLRTTWKHAQRENQERHESPVAPALQYRRAEVTHSQRVMNHIVWDPNHVQQATTLTILPCKYYRNKIGRRTVSCPCYNTEVPKGPHSSL